MKIGTRVLYLDQPGTVTDHDIDWSEGFAMPYVVVTLDNGVSKCCPIPDSGGRMRPLADEPTQPLSHDWMNTMIKTLLAAIILFALGIIVVILDGAASRAHSASYSIFPNDRPAKDDPTPDYSVFTGETITQMQLPVPRVIRLNGGDGHGANNGGNVRAHERRVNEAIRRGDRVEIDDACWSACALWLKMPWHRLCATSRTVFGFHWVTDMRTGEPMHSETRRIFAQYPPRVQLAILAAGGLGKTDIRIKPSDIGLPICR